MGSERVDAGPATGLPVRDSNTGIRHAWLLFEPSGGTMDDLLADLLHEFRRHKGLAERAMVQLDDQDFFRRPGEQVNPVALIVKHLAGNLASRWTDFLTTDGEKPTRDRDGEFILNDE